MIPNSQTCVGVLRLARHCRRPRGCSKPGRWSFTWAKSRCPKLLDSLEAVKIKRAFRRDERAPRQVRYQAALRPDCSSIVRFDYRRREACDLGDTAQKWNAPAGCNRAIISSGSHAQFTLRIGDVPSESGWRVCGATAPATAPGDRPHGGSSLHSSSTGAEG